MQLSMTLFGLQPDEYAPIAVRAEQLGFEALWFGDHLVTPTSFAAAYPYDDTGRPNYDASTPIVDVAVLIGHLAAVTTVIRLGPGVFILPLRNPFATARAFATAQDLSGGRLLFGVGVGWMREEFDAVGEAFDDRGRRTDEILHVLDVLWRGEPTSCSTDRRSGTEVRFSPPPCAPIPIVLGGTTAAALRRAARFGSGWFAPHRPLQEALDVRRRLDVELQRHDRSGDRFDIWYRVVDPPEVDVRHRYEDAGVEHAVIGPFWAGGSDRSSPLADKLASIERAAGLLLR